MQTERLVDEFSKALNDFQEFQGLEKEKTRAQVIRDRQSVKRMKVWSSDALFLLFIARLFHLIKHIIMTEILYVKMNYKSEYSIKFDKKVVHFSQILNN